MTTIARKRQKDNGRHPEDILPPREGFLARVPDGTLTVAVVVLASLGSFGLGMLAERSMGQGSEKVRIEAAPDADVSAGAEPAVLGTAAVISARPLAAPTVAPAATGPTQYVASKSGKSYHLPWCSGAKQIKEENKIYFSSKEEAEAAGYAPAKNCKGL